MNSHQAEEILKSYQRGGLGGQIGFGERPALLVVDFINGFTDPESPLAAPLDNEIRATARLLRAARSRSIPVIFSTVSYENPRRDAGLFIRKVRSLGCLKSGSPWVEIDSRLEKKPDELVLVKKLASCFFGTSLASHLNFLRVDTLLVTGCTTSGCVRATVVDALQHGFRPVVPRECVGDRSAAPHVANLLDMESKYADVVTLRRAIAYLRRVGKK